MGHKEKKAYLEAIRRRYTHSNRNHKKLILNEFCAICGYNRKYAIRLLNCPLKRSRRKPGRKSRYTDPGFLRILSCIWNATDFMCSCRLKTVIPDWLTFYEQSYEPISDEHRVLLLAISRATLDRVLRPLRAKYGKGLCGTKPGTILRNQIPIRTDHWDITCPGFMEADTVAHCGNSLAGQFIWSLTMTDIQTAWTECRAVWCKGSHDVIEQVKCIEQHLPFPVQGFDCDNGSEFLNHHLVRYFTDRNDPVKFTRSRPYKKNDNAHVEQKNWTHPRHLLGYDRLEDASLIPLINDLYANEWSLYQNYFCPSLKLLSKTRVGSKYKKTYHKPQTPFQRVLESDCIAASTKNQLSHCKENLNPFELKKIIERKLKAIFKNVSVTSIVRQRI
jgi:hypothetical protein